jgi:hypothetical protein
VCDLFSRVGGHVAMALPLKLINEAREIFAGFKGAMPGSDRSTVGFAQGISNSGSFSAIVNDGNSCINVDDAGFAA